MIKSIAIREGIVVIGLYESNPSCQAEHDELYVGSFDPSKMTAEHRQKLDDLGWMYDENLPAWSIFT